MGSSTKVTLAIVPGISVLVVVASVAVVCAWSGDAAPHKHKDQ